MGVWGCVGGVGAGCKDGGCWGVGVVDVRVCGVCGRACVGVGVWGCGWGFGMCLCVCVGAWRCLCVCGYVGVCMSERDRELFWVFLRI